MPHGTNSGNAADRPVTVEVAPGVYQIAVGQGEFAGLYAPNVCLVAGSDRAAFIDTAYGRDDEVKAHLQLWERLGKPQIGAIALTHRHRDHIGGAVELRRATGGEIVCSDAEREVIEEALREGRPVRTVEDGETIDLGGATLEFVYTPGHTLGSLCLYHREQGILFTGDTILGASTTSISPEHGDMGLYVDSLRKLLTFGARLISPGHGPVIRHPNAKIERLIQHRLDRERQILELIRQGLTTTEAMFGAIYPALDSHLRSSALGQIRSHLLKLERDGRVVEAEDGSFGLV